MTEHTLLMRSPSSKLAAGIRLPLPREVHSGTSAGANMYTRSISLSPRSFFFFFSCSFAPWTHRYPDLLHPNNYNVFARGTP